MLTKPGMYRLTAQLRDPTRAVIDPGAGAGCSAGAVLLGIVEKVYGGWFGASSEDTNLHLTFVLRSDGDLCSAVAISHKSLFSRDFPRKSVSVQCQCLVTT